MRKLNDIDIMEIREWFESALNRTINVDKTVKMRMRRKIRDEVFNLLTWEKPTPAAIMNRWDERLNDVMRAMPYGQKEELLRLLIKKMELPRK